jgi:hypothetical protein
MHRLLPTALPRLIATLLLVFCALVSRVEAQGAASTKPKIPPGVDPGGTAIALIGAGIDYTDAQIARRLARDGEGEAIAWDAVDSDARPYVAPGKSGNGTVDGTELANLLLAVYSTARLIPVRIDPADPEAVRRGLAFAARTPARILAFTAWDWTDWAQALLHDLAAHRPDSLLLVPPAQSKSARGTGAFDNVVHVAATAEARGAPSVDKPLIDVLITIDDTTDVNATGSAASRDARAIVRAAAAAACAQQARRPAAGAETKAALLALTVAAEDGGPRRLPNARCPQRAPQ